MIIAPLVTVGSDFGVLVESDVVFTPDNAQDVICRQVPLTNDEFAEETELFLVRLSTMHDYVFPGPPINITVFDNDSKF